MPPSLLDVLYVASSAARIASRSATIQTAQWAHRSRLPEYRSRQQSQNPTSNSNPALQVNLLEQQRKAAASLNDIQSYVHPDQPGDFSQVAEAALESGCPAVEETPLFDGGNAGHETYNGSAKGAPMCLSSSSEENVVPAPGSPPSKPVLPSQRVEGSTLLDEPTVTLKPSRVPSSRLARLLHYGGLAAGLGVGAASEFLRRRNRQDTSTPIFLSETNVARLVDKLGKMRGAALKLGQFLSIQDAHVLPPQLEAIFQQLQNKANYMPDSQMQQVMNAELGTNWRLIFEDFDAIPIASASIGQVHRARLADTGMEVAVKIQFPNVAESIVSDLSNLSLLLTTSSLLPPGLFLQNTITAMQQELADECDYEREARYMQNFAHKLHGDEMFNVPRVVSEYTTKRVLVMEWMHGVPLTRAIHFDQNVKNEIASAVLRLCLRELFELSMMQTDPNWTNFLWNPTTHQIELIDFGATREYSQLFIKQWLRLLRAAINSEKEQCLQASRAVGYLTGEENEEMVSAHLEAMFLLAQPFRESSDQPYQFKDQTITTQIKALIPIMLRHRLTPPPRETYSLNRMLSGAFLLCARLDAEVYCSQIWHETTDCYEDNYSN
ncbi:ABC1-domain-containing protein [Dacryopinax primogenitus]|uniref:ABC1-domain-containing protein n=1 Tax=Dacryopinax primogenitus (strain DJM 731) TaxID=1858805 RepID=M5FNB6_DACPD|nr:ABC1-domain-containing protein [Dacryopinax primogenitus]EJT97160.1 ABC1-domain-containing protein [Dacryopinax primogenitus]